MSKRALIVDDSRSARVILSRMLEGYGLEVDSSESAEAALEYLRQARPDVIFMDHLMPGMDGFQAIQAIKGNPDTATIPVIMYTSQEGELYVSQARALGAVGVLPKTVKHADVSRVLYQLRLLPERREARASLQVAQQEGSAAVQIEPVRPSGGELEIAIRNAIAPLLKEHSSEMRRFVLASLEGFARRISSEGKPVPTPAPAEPAVAPPPQPLETQTVMVRQNRWPLAAGVGAIALIPALVLALFLTKELETNKALRGSLTTLQATIDGQQAQLTTLQRSLQSGQTAAVAAAPKADNVTSEVVPYGEAPLSGSRLERLREMLGQLRANNFRGKVKVATFVGEFCLTGNGIEGYSMATDELPVNRCDLVGNPFEDSLPTAQRQSLAFANLLSSLRQDGGVTVEVAHEGRRPSVPYPSADQRARVTAGEWNRIAAQNNRVEFATEPAGS
ncbi:response regulator [Steroidobacter sp. S1-65]|uniref:Response regulator n=1 Tax=Steroidobacter gossypii TaxID=2805490 RepID=A0ABS1WS73_9GAMM|nr:response regulator [Steroidobacter gossypii]MBM0103826.1 response regulator [Steroidobacter gossypii]